jgi:hypothetical protein
MKKILLSVLLISGSAWMCWGIYFYFRISHVTDPKYQIVALVQTGPEKEALKSAYLAEILGLSWDRPSNLYRFHLREGEAKLLACSLIKRAAVRRIPPGTLYLDYEIRKPIAFLADFFNTAIDEEGYLFPFKPFYSPKRLPEIVLGVHGELYHWGDRVQAPSIQLALAVLRDFSLLFDSSHTSLVRIDVSRTSASSFGDQQLVIVLEKWHEQEDPLRKNIILNPENYLDGLLRYLALEKHLTDQSFQVVDLRLEQLGYLEVL